LNLEELVAEAVLDENHYCVPAGIDCNANVSVCNTHPQNRCSNWRLTGRNCTLRGALRQQFAQQRIMVVDQTLTYMVKIRLCFRDQLRVLN
jgi:adenosyl cobinamide kinase/adenosyl cobinamide phosphate guanylyltransferase